MSAVVKSLGRYLLIILATLVVGFVASALSGVLVALSANATINGLRIEFNPMITLAYLVLAYLLAYFNGMSKQQMFGWCLFALFLSYTINFISGSLLLVLLPPALKKLKLVA